MVADHYRSYMRIISKNVARNVLVFSAVLFALSLLTIVYIIFFRTEQHGSRLVYENPETGYQQVFPRWKWLYLDGATFPYSSSLAPVTSMHFDTYIDTANNDVWRVAHHGGITIQIDDEVVFTEDAIFEITQYHELSLETGIDDIVHVVIDYNFGIEQVTQFSRFRTGLYERNLLGQWSLIPTFRLYPEPPNVSVMDSSRNDHIIFTLAKIGLAFSVLLAVMCVIIYKQLWRRNFWLIVAVILVAFLVRGVVLTERIANENGFWFWDPGGSDNYLIFSLETISGSQNYIAGAYFSPGLMTFYAGLLYVLGPGLLNLHLIMIVLGALSTGAIFGAGWLAFDKRTGLVAGIISALFPPLIFYHTTLQIAALAPTLIAFTVFLGMWTLQRPVLLRAVLLGLFIGVGSLIRSTMLILLPAFWLAILLSNDRKSYLKVAITTTVFCAIAIAPQTLANRSVGKPDLISSNGAINLLIGNNRQASGVYDFSQIVEMGQMEERFVNRSLTRVALDEIRRDPIHAIELTFRK